VRPDGLLAAAPLVLRFAPDRRRYAAASNLAEAGQVVEPAFCLSAIRITANWQIVPLCDLKISVEFGAPGRIRTADHCVRSAVLYPAELRAPARSLALMGPIGNLPRAETTYQRSPPPAMMISPVTQAELSEARNTATEAMSLG
jgi:hypothetical protein